MKTLNDIIDLLKTQNVTLFLGAGNSLRLGGPSGKDLLERVIQKFSDLDFRNRSNFFDVCEDIIGSDSHSRVELEDYIKKQFIGLKPDESIIKLISLPWKCIFTTNYDLVIERIPENRLKTQSIRQVTEDNPQIYPDRIDILYYIKIFGSIDCKYNEEGFPVLSNIDKSISFLRRNAYYSHLSECLKKGPVLFIGYSFEDDIVFTIMEELLSSRGSGSFQHSYALTPNDIDERKIKKFSRYDIHHIKGTVENFVFQADLGLKNYDFESHLSEKTVHIRGIPIDIPLNIERPSQEYLEFLNLTSMTSKYSNIRKFFSGEDDSYYPFEKGWDFKREIYEIDEQTQSGLCQLYNVQTGFKKFIFNNIDSPSQDDNLYAILTGPAGCGKTIILKRLAYDWYSYGNPVIFLKPQASHIDRKQLEAFIEYIESAYKKVSGYSKPRPRTLLICDNASSIYRDIISLFSEISSRGKAINLIISDRENLFAGRNFSGYPVYRIPESITSSELTTFRDYLYSNKLIESDAELFNIYDNPKINQSFFALMYTLIDESKRPLNTIIHDQYQKLKDWQKAAYEYTCLFNKYRLNLNEEILVNATINEFKKFRDEVKKGSLKSILFPVDEQYEEVDYRVHHPIIAERTVDFEFGEPGIIAQKITELISNVNPQYPHQVNQIENLLIFKIGPNSNEKEIPISLKRDIFEVANQRLKSRSICHHYALLEIEEPNANYKHAEQLLKEALAINQSRERDELIFTSFGKLYAKMGYVFADKGKNSDAEKYYKMAELNFERGRSKHFKNQYSYHGHISLLIRKAIKSSNSLEKITHLSRALQLCEEAINVLDQSEHIRFLEEKGRIFSLSNDIEKFDEIVDLLAKEYKSSAGYKLKANILYRKLADLERTPETLSKYNELDQLIETGLTIEATDPELLRLKARVSLILHKDDKTYLLKILKTWYQHAQDNDLYVLFRYGVTLFEKDSYEKSKHIFEELDQLSEGYKTKSTLNKVYYIMENGTNKEYLGKITQVSSNGKTIKIKCSSLPNLKYDIGALYPEFEPIVNDYVKFNIAFNFRGIIGKNVKKN